MIFQSRNCHEYDLSCRYSRIRNLSYLFPSSNANPTDKYVLISGYDTEFGHQLAVQLDQRGFHVFVRNILLYWLRKETRVWSILHHLRREMTSWGLRVCIIEPGFMRTPIIQGRSKSFDDIWSTICKEARTRCGEEFIHQIYRRSNENYSSIGACCDEYKSSYPLLP